MYVSKKGNSKWTGKMWAAVGDSITAGAQANITYYQYLASKIGCTALNYGISGTGWRTPSAYGGNDAFYQRLGSINSSADLITVFGGTNDWDEVGISMTLGVLGDTSATASFYGAVDNVLSTLVNNFPTKTIAVFTPIQRNNAWYNLTHAKSTIATSWAASTAKTVNSYMVPNPTNGYVYVCTTAGTTGAVAPTWPTATGATVTDGTAIWTVFGPTPDTVSLQDISTAIIAVANKYNIPVLDLYKIGNMYMQNATFRSTYAPDGLHPNDAGHKLMADKILAFLNTL